MLFSTLALLVSIVNRWTAYDSYDVRQEDIRNIDYLYFATDSSRRYLVRMIIMLMMRRLNQFDDKAQRRDEKLHILPVVGYRWLCSASGDTPGLDKGFSSNTQIWYEVRDMIQYTRASFQGL